jgi:hypothetical protein
MLVLAGVTDLRAMWRAVEKVQNAVTSGNPELPAVDPKHPKESPAQPTSRELPRSGASDPRNEKDPDTGHPAPKKAPVPDPDAGAPETPVLPNAPFDPNNRSFPPR